MRQAVARRVWAWRRLGPRRGTEVALRRLQRAGYGELRRAVVRVRPPRVTPAQLAHALGDSPLAAVLAGRMHDALPALARWEAELDADPAARAAVVATADDVLAHRFDLLGSGPVELGPAIDWHRDFIHGRSWPLVHHTRIRTSYGDGSDIKVPWELSRAQHLPILAAAHRLTGEARYADEVGAQLRAWIAANPVEYGVNWACTMDVGIRAANWIAALALLGPAPWTDEVAASLLLHGRFIRSHLETHIARGNHYLSDVAGLLVVAALFAGDEGRAWLDWGANQLEREMAHQVRPDGSHHEMALSYHHLVAEELLTGAGIVEALAPGRLTPAFHERLGRMFDLIADVTRPDGLVPVAGDADDGRFLPLGDYGSTDPRAQLPLLRRAGREAVAGTANAAYPDGGWWVLRAGGTYVLARCGDVGVDGEGTHAHNDLLAFEFAAGREPLVIDPGSYVYSSDPAARNAFRATAAHATLRVGGAEQRPIPTEGLFALSDVPQRLIAWEHDAGGGGRWVAEHEGFPALPGRTRHRRELVLAPDGALTIADTVELAAPQPLEWGFPLAPGASAAVEGDGVVAQIGAVELRIEGADVEWTVEPGRSSPSYGVAVDSPVVRARRTGPAGVSATTFRLVASARAE